MARKTKKFKTMAPDSAKKRSYAPPNDEWLEDEWIVSHQRKQHLISYLSFFCWLLIAVWAKMASIWDEYRTEQLVKRRRLRERNPREGLITTDDGGSLKEMISRLKLEHSMKTSIKT